MAAKSCPERKNEQPHCWHAISAPVQSPQAVLFPSMCCWCAPEYYHIQVFLPAQVSDEDMVAVQMAHGHLVTIDRMQVAQAPSRLIAPNSRPRIPQ